MVIYRMSDRIPVKIKDVTFFLAPLSLSQQGILLSFAKQKEGEEKVDALKTAMKCISFSLKAVEGLTTVDGLPYELEFKEDGTLTDDCVNEILQVNGDSLVKISLDWAVSGIKPIEIPGVEIDFKNVRSVKKN